MTAAPKTTASTPDEMPQALSLARGSATVDLSKHTDEKVLEIVSRERPKFAEVLCAFADRGMSDAEIIKLVCCAGGSPQAMRYAQKCLRALRALPNHVDNHSGKL